VQAYNKWRERVNILTHDCMDAGGRAMQEQLPKGRKGAEFAKVFNKKIWNNENYT